VRSATSRYPSDSTSQEQLIVMRVIAPAPRTLWRAVLEEDPQSLPEHAPEWIDAMVASGSYSDASRFYEFSDGRRFVLPFVRRRGLAAGAGWYGSFPPASGIGGLVGGSASPDVVAAVVDDLRMLGAARISLRPNPLRAADWAEVTGPGVVRISRRAHVLDLSGGNDAVRSGLSKMTVRGIRTAEKHGVRVERDRNGSLLPIYDELYRTSVERWAKNQHEPVGDPRRRMCSPGLRPARASTGSFAWTGR
jgi:hypothetical protein